MSDPIPVGRVCGSCRFYADHLCYNEPPQPVRTRSGFEAWERAPVDPADIACRFFDSFGVLNRSRVDHPTDSPNVQTPSRQVFGVWTVDQNNTNGTVEVVDRPLIEGY